MLCLFFASQGTVKSVRLEAVAWCPRVTGHGTSHKFHQTSVSKGP